MQTTTNMTVTSSSDDDVLVLLCLFNILSAAIAFFLHLRLVHRVKILKQENAYTFEVLEGLQTSCDNLVDQTKKLKSMLKVKHHLLELDIQGIMPQIKEEMIKLELFYQTQVLNKSYHTSATDAPTLSDEWDHNDDDDDYGVLIEDTLGVPVIGRQDGEIEMTGVRIERFLFEEECGEDDSVSL